jgi:hypothetical protein
MSYDLKTWDEFNKLDEQNELAAAMYASFMSKLKPKGSNYTPPKKKRKKKK